MTTEWTDETHSPAINRESARHVARERVGGGGRVAHSEDQLVFAAARLFVADLARPGPHQGNIIHCNNIDPCISFRGARVIAL